MDPTAQPEQSAIIGPMSILEETEAAVQKLPPLFPHGPLAQDVEHQPAEVGQRRTVRCAGPIQFIKCRARVVGIFPNDSSTILLVGAVLLEQHEHWPLEGRVIFFGREHGNHPGIGRHPCPAGPQRLREAGRRPRVIKAAAPHRA